MSSSQLKGWEIENAIELVDVQRDGLYAYSVEEQRKINDAKPWRSDPNFFKSVRISAVALLKMVMHARSGGSIEVMGLMQGKVAGNTFVVTDAFRLPVEGTETRVNALGDANAYMVEYLQKSRDSGLQENAVGWYHSHPGYGCWLSGIDVDTQVTQQTYMDPYLAIVIDPDRTISAGKVDIGAFRTYPEGYKPTESYVDNDFQPIPLKKTEDFGAHANRYYSLEVTHYKSTLDTHLLEQLWNKYWVSTLSQSPLFTNKEYTTRQMDDLSQKLRISEKQVKLSHPRVTSRVGAKDSHLEKVIRASDKLAGEEERGILADDVKTKLFNNVINDTV